MKKLCVFLALVLVLGLCGCQEEESSSRRKSDRDQKRETVADQVADFGRMGWAVDVGDTLYYWQYAAESYDKGALMGFFSTSKPATLVRRDQKGNETALLETNACEFVVTRDAIYYQVEDSIWTAKTDGSDQKKLTAGQLMDVDESGQYLITGLDGVYHSYSIKDDELTCIINEGTFEGFHDGVVYYSTEISSYEDAQKGMMTLRAVNVDGTDDRHLVTTEPDLYDYPHGYSAASIQQIRFGADGVYFSYGSIAGTGSFFQGGRIVRVAYDGSSTEVVAGQTELVDANFGVRDDGTVSTTTDLDFVYYESHSDYYINEDCLYWMDPVTGTVRQIAEADTYNKQVDSDVCYVKAVNVWGDKAIFTVNYANLDPQQAFGWREYAVRVKTVTYILQNGELTELYSF